MRIIRTAGYKQAMKIAGMFDDLANDPKNKGNPLFDKVRKPEALPQVVMPKPTIPREPRGYIINQYGDEYDYEGSKGNGGFSRYHNQGHIDYDPKTNSTIVHLVELERKAAQEIHEKLKEIDAIRYSPHYVQLLNKDEDYGLSKEENKEYQQLAQKINIFKYQIRELQKQQRDIKVHKFRIKGNYANALEGGGWGEPGGRYNINDFYRDELDPTWEKLQ